MRSEEEGNPKEGNINKEEKVYRRKSIKERRGVGEEEENSMSVPVFCEK